ncbi:MAG TPA: response regulator [Kofleriaceae bacterium]|nr:response regulator [Kofleriaceae bacterium]
MSAPDVAGRILVVDDDAAMGDMLVSGLVRRGYAATARRDASSAFAAFREQPFDVVVTDLQMAGGDGLSLCKRLLEDREDVPIIVITAFGSLETAIGAIRAARTTSSRSRSSSTCSCSRSTARSSIAGCAARSPACARSPPARPRPRASSARARRCARSSS